MIILLLASQKVFAQDYTLYQGPDVMRRNQLAGRLDLSLSLMVNPIQTGYLDSLAPLPGSLKRLYKGSLSVLPFTLVQQYNSLHPYGWNSGAMIPAKGYQVMASTGIYTTIGKHISIRLQPEFVYTHNPYFETFPVWHADPTWGSYYQWLNTSDIPERFGDRPYHKALPGQSSIRYNAGKLSLGISTESLWWGPGTWNALIMSNNAPGFLHVTVNTTEPIHTAIGNFEGQIIGGKLDNSGIPVPEQYRINNGQFLYKPKREEWRYMTGMVVTWNPKWVPHLFIGMAKASYLYHSDLSNPLDFLPLQGFFGKYITKTEKQGEKSSLGSMFLRYVMPKEQAEFYLEYGRADASLQPWNLVANPQYRRAYVAGLRKLFDSRRNSHIQLLAELTQTAVPTADLVHNPASWYTNDYVRQGYTQKGRVLGAGIGPGSNSQTLEVSWIKGYKKLGIQFERLNHNADFYYYAFEYIGDFRRHWIDLSTMLKADWDYQRFLFSAQLGLIRSLNYQWYIYSPDILNSSLYFKGGYDVLNFNGKLTVSYRF